MNDRFRFRIPITNLDGQFDRFIFCDVYHEPIHFIGSAIFLTPEQCTGIKDKNGNLIYEGDIIRLPWQAGWPDLIGVVKFNELYASFLLSKTITDRAEQSFWWNNSKEVIGNIHENPELLEAEK